MKTVSRLIEHFRPTHYNLSLTIERVERTFDGIVTVEGVSSSNTIALHSKDLVIESVVVDGRSADFEHKENDELMITGLHIKSGNHTVVVAFSGVISDGMHGLYPSYFNHDGTKKELLATQFESHHAREVFPCVDEPEAKASFDVTLTTEKNVSVLSNMPVKNQSIENDRLVTSFDRTPNMSSYLLAWVIGELHKKTAVSKHGTEVSIWATPAQSTESFDFALGIATRTIDFFNEFFGVKYPLPKSDHVALPDFSSGAMENWGLITYRETTLLVDPKTTSVSSKHYIATVIAHELSHQWFGNLVTMRWWNNLWLNESFATLMEYIAVDALEPSWDVWLDFASHETLAALRRDSLDGVQAVQVDVDHPDEISTLFDGAIVYAKGARLLHMLQNYIGPEAFKSGLSSYFKKFAYGNTEADDLWNELSKSSGVDVADFMNSWISRSGFPVIHLKKSDNRLEISQNQFFVGPHEPSKKIWPIPLDSNSDKIPKVLFEKKISLDGINDNDLIFNRNNSGHFITHYDDSTLDNLIKKIEHGEMKSPLHRLQLLHEQTMLARGGVVQSAKLIPLIAVFKHETNESVWGVVAATIAEIKKFVETDEVAESKLRGFTRTLALKQYQRLGWEAQADEPESDTKLRAIILSLMVYGEDQNAIKKAQEIFKTTELDDMNPELRPLIISTVILHDNSPEIQIEKLMKIHADTSSSELQSDIAAGITSTKDTDCIQKLLAQLKNPDLIRSQDIAQWFVYLVRSRHSRQAAWKWLQVNWSWIEKTFAGDKSYDDFARFPALALSTRSQLEEYVEFFKPLQSVPALKRTISLGSKEIQSRVELIEESGEAVRQSLRNL